MSIGAVMGLLLVACAMPAAVGVDPMAEWTILVYLDGDNNLDPDSLSDIEEMMMVGSTDKVNVLVLWDRYSEPAYLYKVLEGELQLMDGLMVNGMAVNGQEISMADWRVLEAFVDYGKANMPARHYMLDLWDHGNAYGYACWDDHWEYPWVPEARAISLKNMVKALDGSGTTDILTYDGCTIGMVEIAYNLTLIPEEMGVQIGYLVASEEYIPNSGYAYNRILAEMNAMKDISDPAAVGMMLADLYAECYSPKGQAKGSSTVGLSSIDLSKVGPIGDAMKSLSGALIDGLVEHFDYYHDMIADARGEGNLGWSLNGWDQRIDLGAMLAALAEQTFDMDVKMAAAAALDVIQDSVYVANTPALHSQDAYGLGTWFPVSYKSLGNANAGYSSVMMYTSTFEYAEDAGWMDLLYAFWNKGLSAK